jgi:hypothetical protein
VGKRYLILDRDPLYTSEFREAMEQGGVKVIRLPPGSPNLNAFAERFVLSIRTRPDALAFPLRLRFIAAKVRGPVQPQVP